MFLFSAIQGYVADLFSFLFGNVLAIGTADLIALLVLGLGVVLTVAVLWKELLYATFDPLGAAASGIPSTASSTCSWPLSHSRSWSACRPSGSSSSSRCWSRRRRPRSS